MTKRIFSLIFCIVVCLLLMSAGVFADLADTAISEVNITVPALYGGQTAASLIPVCTAAAGGDALNNAAFISADWEVQNGSVWEPLAGTDTIVAGRTYRLTDPMVYLAGGYSFADGVTVKLNGKTVNPTEVEDVIYFDAPLFTAACSVSFEMNGHATEPEAQYDADGSLLEPAVPSDEAYAFVGWFFDASLTQPVTFPAKLTADTTLYASWKSRVKTVDINVTQVKYAPPSVLLGASYTVDGTTDNTSSVFAQYTSPDGTSWKAIRYSSEVPYGTQNKIEFTVSLTDNGARMIDEATAITVHGAEGADCDIKRTADSVKVTVLYELPAQKFTVKFDTDGQVPAIPDQEVDALSTVTLPDMSAYTEGRLRFRGWFYGPNPGKKWEANDVVYEDTTLTAHWGHYVKVTFVMSCNGEEIVCWEEYGASLKYSLDELYAHEEYYVFNVHYDKKMDHAYAGEKIFGDITMYAYAKTPIREVDFTQQEPSAGKTMTPDVRVTFADPENSVKVEYLGKWYVSDDGNSWRAMKTDEKFADGHFYRYSGLTFERTDENMYYFDNRYIDIVLKRNGNVCEWNKDAGGSGYVKAVSYVLTGMVEFELNGHGKFIRSQDIQPGQKAARPDDPTASGWKFTGWYTDKDCTTLYDFETPVNSNLLLYAGWEARIDQVDADFTLPWLHCKAGSTMTALTANHKEADLSASRILWKKSNGGSWVLMDAGEEFLPDADYRAEFTVIADSTILFAENVQVTVRGSDAGVTSSFDASGNLKVVYTKHLEYTSHKVTFDTEGKDAPIDPQTVEEGLTVKCLADPSCEGFVFDGWYTDTAHTKKFGFDSPIVEDMTLYAHWKRPIHRVTVTVPALIEGKTPPESVFLSTEYGEEGLWFIEEKAEWEKDNTRPLDYWHIFGRLQANQDYTIRDIAIPVAGNDWFFADDLEIVSSTGSVAVTSISSVYAEVNIKVTVKSGGISNPDNPQTGDSSMFLWVPVLFVGGAALTVASFRSGKRKQKEF